ncbi:hypothetical protein [Congregibacter sp.]|uniref:hypothetical protein n=1 Tax=Congregibacter sp. TaxID=2744308 RepID=UPI003F6AFACD
MQLSETTQIRSLIAAGAALALCVLVLAVVLRFPAAPAGSEPLGALDAITLPNNELVLLVEGALLRHERSGLAKVRLSASDLGYDRIAPPLWTTPTGDLLLNASQDGGELQLQRCNLDERSCSPFDSQNLSSPVIAIAGSLLGDTLFLLGADGQLWRSSSLGNVEAEATVEVPWGQPRILSKDGLLLAPAADSPMLGVYRPDEQNFGQQLDALLIMPPAAVAAAQDRLQDVALGEENYWALMAGDESVPELYKFDTQWGSAERIDLPEELIDPFLIPWRDKLLVADRKQAVMQRLANEGTVEAPFESSLLAEERDTWIRTSQQRTLMRQLGIGLPIVLILFCASVALLYAASYRSLQSMPQKRSALLDPMPGGIHWLPSSEKAARAIARAGMTLFLCSLLTLLLCAALGGWRAALASLPAVIASLYAWRFLRQGCGGHLGLLDEYFIAVDYDGKYFYGERSLLRGSASIILAPGVALPVSIAALPNLDVAAVPAMHYSPKTKSGAVEILGALWLLSHPWMKAVLLTVGGFLLSGSLLLIVS